MGRARQADGLFLVSRWRRYQRNVGPRTNSNSMESEDARMGALQWRGTEALWHLSRSCCCLVLAWFVFGRQCSCRNQRELESKKVRNGSRLYISQIEEQPGYYETHHVAANLGFSGYRNICFRRHDDQLHLRRAVSAGAGLLQRFAE